jgi:hypothetical protein
VDNTQSSSHNEPHEQPTETTASHTADEAKIDDTKNSPDKQKKNAKPNPSKSFNNFIKKVSKYQAAIMLIVVGGLLALTALRMLHYANPPADDKKIQENLTKFKKIHIDQKTVQRIEQLKDSEAAPGTSIENSRTNPFAE